MKIKMLVGKDKGKVIDLDSERVQCIVRRGKGAVVKEAPRAEGKEEDESR